jgi:two-component system NtrC family response regulator
MIKDGTFRLDLYYRIRGLTLELPPVRDRGDDLALLVDAILGDLAKKHGQSLTLCEDAVRLLGRYHWPGNVRELENVLRSVYFFAQGGQITADDLTTYTLLREVKMSSLSVAGVDAAPLEEGFNLNEAKRSLEIQCIEKALGQTGGNITQAAKLLGMKRPRLSQKIKEYRLSRRSREVR